MKMGTLFFGLLLSLSLPTLGQERLHTSVSDILAQYVEAKNNIKEKELSLRRRCAEMTRKCHAEWQEFQSLVSSHEVPFIGKLVEASCLVSSINFATSDKLTRVVTDFLCSSSVGTLQVSNISKQCNGERFNRLTLEGRGVSLSGYALCFNDEIFLKDKITVSGALAGMDSLIRNGAVIDWVILIGGEKNYYPPVTVRLD